ncbi:MAG: putative bacteriophage protein [Phenylobacterium sp.]|nr:putative bacteriophage protein [Phenylobacterium sp.]
MTIAYSDFIGRFPEFGNATTFPQANIDPWIADGYAQLSPTRFGGRLDLAVMLFAAHNVVLGAREAASAAAGGIPGEVKGPVASKSVDKVSVSYTDAASIDGAGAWNLTTYGLRLYKMFRAVGAGPYYVPGPRRVFGA